MSCQDLLVRQLPCPSTYLFTLWKTAVLRLCHASSDHSIGRNWRRWRPAGTSATLLSVLMLSAFLLGSLLQHSASAVTLATPSHSTTIALTADETRLVVVNREANSVSIIQVKDAQGNDVANKLAEIAVNVEPRCVAVHPNNQVAYVTNAINGTVSFVDLVQNRVATTVGVGTEPAGLRSDAERQPALCSEPYSGLGIYPQHEHATRPDYPCDAAGWA
jgi:YVTN family beta-propeller protein